MSSLDAVKTILAADSTLLTIATGGVFVPDDLGRMGLNPSNPQAANAFDSDGHIKPCIVLKIGSATPMDGLSDDGLQRVAQRERMECWFYEDNGYANIDAMRTRVFVDLQGIRLSNGGKCRWAFDTQPSHDIDLDACMQRADYAVTGMRS